MWKSLKEKGAGFSREWPLGVCASLPLKGIPRTPNLQGEGATPDPSPMSSSDSKFTLDVFVLPSPTHVFFSGQSLDTVTIV